MTTKLEKEKHFALNVKYLLNDGTHFQVRMLPNPVENGRIIKMSRMIQTDTQSQFKLDIDKIYKISFGWCQRTPSYIGNKIENIDDNINYQDAISYYVSKILKEIFKDVLNESFNV